MINVRTDLALEAREIYKESHKDERDIDGIEVLEETDKDIKVTTVKVKNDDGAKKLGKPKGNYVTIDIPQFTAYDGETMDRVSEVVAEVLSRMIEIDVEKTILVVGLGNWQVTPDALGPKVTQGIMVTRHLKTVMPEAIDNSVRPVCSISPGVLGVTGVETVEIIKGVVERVKPDMVICIDALAARRVERVNNTIQIGDTGISPGAGVGNNRKQINEENLGVKVIAIGVPTVVDAVTIANDTIDLVVDSLIHNSKSGNEFYEMLKNLDKNEKGALIREVLSSKALGEMIVTPKDIDKVIESLAKIIANGINIAVQPNMDMEDINKFMN
ncbi:GPR endopeptidase [Clostridium sp. SM-530-WT-3G]|uniref:GPR endopeptidase n=1 Tax=Clostridium sp. SM-530-WT-3G TaxID=2725303 RepID=UPI00145ECFA2|nr:GPR endopeptidase [Clostridium sp. SM-530-WT-3G]NME82948.1 GPR endopeptidase [Clostridium sp. SM-530-WT-3G]